MKKYLFLITGILMSSAQAGFCLNEAIGDELGQSLKNHSSDPSIGSVLFALIVVVILIYVTGLIYSKLNILGAKTVQGQLKNYDLSKVVVLSTTQLGPHKNLHVIEINSKRYLIGATQNSINLIKELDEIKAQTKKEAEESLEPSVDDAIDLLYGTDEEEPTLQLKLEPVEEFDIHKKYL